LTKHPTTLHLAYTGRGKDMPHVFQSPAVAILNADAEGIREVSVIGNMSVLLLLIRRCNEKEKYV